MAIEFLTNVSSAINKVPAKSGAVAAGQPGSVTDAGDLALESNGGGFGGAIKSAIESIDASQKTADGQIADAVSGKSPDLHKTIIALQTADLKFQLGMQVRNKLIGAYEEIMRMQV